MNNKFKNMKLRITKKSNGKFAVQQLSIQGNTETWIELVSNKDTFEDAESYIVNTLKYDVKEEVKAVYEYNVKTVNP